MRLTLTIACVLVIVSPLAAQNPLSETGKMNSKTHSLVIQAPPEKVFGFLSKAENLPKWAVAFCHNIERRAGRWWVATPGGELQFRIDADAKTGVLDMFVGPTDEQMELAPARVIGLPGGRSLFLFTAIQYPGTNDEVFEAQCHALVSRELPELKRQVAVSAFSSSPLRNRLRVELKAPVLEVWSLVGNLARFPEYSSGLERVEVKKGANGAPTEYVCHFKPREVGAERISSRELIRWYEPSSYASSGAGGDTFGLTNDLNLVTVEPTKEGAIVTWDEYYDTKDLAMMKTHFDEALGDIGNNLVRRFGGRVVERYVEK